MSWTTPRTWATGELVTSALLNAQIRDNELELRTTPQHRCYVYATAPQAVATGPFALAMTAEVYDTALMHSASNSTIEIHAAGTYLVHGSAIVTGANSGTAGIHLRKNGSQLVPAVRHYFQTSSTDWENQDLQVTAYLVLADTDTLELFGETSGNTFQFTAQLMVIGPLPPA